MTLMECLDLGLDQCDEEGVRILVRDSPKVLYQFVDSDDIKPENAVKAGKKLKSRDCISFIFLLLPDSNALKLCKQIEDGSLEKSLPEGGTVGGAILSSFLPFTKQNKAWIHKILCALHCISQYQAIHLLQPSRFEPGGSGPVKKEFEGNERNFVNCVRFNLYTICKNLELKAAKRLMESIGEFESWKRMETALLSRIVTLGGQDAVVQLLKEAHNGDLNRVTQENVQSTALLREFLPSPDDLILQKGNCLIIAQDTYKDSSYSKRDGTEHDIAELAKTFKTFGCNNGRVKIKKDIEDAQGFRQAMSQFRDSLADDIDYAVICILSHGSLNPATKQEVIVGTSGQAISSEELLSMINDAGQCPQLVDKPKIFLIQACRGNEDNSTSFAKLPGKIEKIIQQVESDSAGSNQLRESWYFEAYSTPRNYTAYRNPLKGSPFIQSFCQNMNNFGDRCYSLEKIMKEVMKDLERQSPPQCPVFRTCIPKDLYFSKEQRRKSFFKK